MVCMVWSLVVWGSVCFQLQNGELALHLFSSRSWRIVSSQRLVRKISERLQYLVAGHVRKERGGDSPCAPAILLRLLCSARGCGGENDFVHARPDVATREPLQLFSCLEKQTAVGHNNSDAAPVAQPHKEAREA